MGLTSLSGHFSMLRPMRMPDVWNMEVSGGVGAVRSSESVKRVFLHSHVALGTFRPRVSFLNATTSQLPATIKTIAFPGAGASAPLKAFLSPEARPRKRDSQGMCNHYTHSAANGDSSVYRRGYKSSMPASTSLTPLGVDFAQPNSPRLSDRKPLE